jgi:exopolyphosphatase / guanosine-5'-triphosphate,3'-diphosphate pyrophosphatase
LDQKLAVIDIGTNTINILVASKNSNGFHTEFFDRIPAKLGKGGMEEGILTDEAMQRGLEALSTHRDSCKLHGVHQVKVTATSAVRSASNGQDFVKKVKEKLNLEIEIIDGDREADLIWKGVRLTGLLDQERGLIMDIGGGSTEFILADANQVYWKKSYDLGVTRLAERFKAPDPFTEQAEKQMMSDMQEVWEALARYPTQRLIGASGSFNSLSMILAEGRIEELHPIHESIDMHSYVSLSEKLRRSLFQERESILGLVPDRVDTIPYSVLLIDTMLKNSDLNKMLRSSYALKEGLMGEMME